MPDLRALIMNRPQHQPWEEGQGVVPDQPVARIDPAALAATLRVNLPSSQTPDAPSDEAYALAQQAAARQGLVGRATAPAAQAFQAIPLGGGKVAVDEGIWARVQAVMKRYLGGGQ